MKRLIVISSILLAASGLMTKTTAERELIDQVVAVVDDEAVFESDVIMVMNQLMFQQGRTALTDSERDELHDEVLQNLINDKLIIAQAKRLNIEIPFSTVEERVNQALEENRRTMGSDAFERQLEREGFTLESLKQLYRDQIRNRLLVEEVLRSEVDRGAIEISDDELRKFYEIRLGPSAEGEDGPLLVLEPKKRRARKRVAEVRLQLDPQSYLPVFVEYLAKDGGSRSIDFADVRINPDLAAGLYEMDLPAGVKMTSGFSGLPDFNAEGSP